MKAVAVGRGLFAGLTGTTAMATTTLLQRALTSHRGPIDYDDSLIAVRLAQRWTPLELHGQAERVVNQAMRFGYGTIGGGLLLRVIDGRVRRRALTLFGVMWIGEAVALRVVGAAPSPWRWSRSVLVTSLAQHAIFAGTAVLAYRTMNPDSRHPLPADSPTERRGRT